MKLALVNLQEIERIGGIASGHNPDIANALRILETNDLIKYDDAEPIAWSTPTKTGRQLTSFKEVADRWRENSLIVQPLYIL